MEDKRDLSLCLTFWILLLSQKIKCKYGRIIIGDLIKEDSVKKIKEIFKISDLEFNKKYTDYLQKSAIKEVDKLMVGGHL